MERPPSASSESPRGTQPGAGTRPLPPTSPAADTGEDRASAERPPSRFELWLVERVLVGLGRPPISVLFWNGEEVRVCAGEPVARLRLRERRLIRDLLRNPDLAFGEGYVDGRLDVEGDLLQLLETTFGAHAASARWARALGRAMAAHPLPNSLRRSRRNVRHHYDLGNDFYALWLDEQLLYTCAYFPTPELTLEQGQLAKMDHVCRKVGLRSGERVVEAGCGWGSLALHMAERYGVRVRAFNVSGEQIRYARDEARRRALEGRVEFVEDDYRNITGTYDAFVSVGMLEHVGRTHYRALGRVIDRCLAPHGRGLLHSIGRSRPQPMNAWIERYIFPGAYIPSLREMLTVTESRNLATLDVENLRLHYEKTLEHWLARFEKATERVAERFGDPFVRMWRLYLASSIAAFRTGSCHLYQVVFSRASNNAIPWTRAYLYEGA